MITTNIYTRVYRVHFGGSAGTAFSIEVEGKQYVVTAKHLLTDKEIYSINIDYDGTFCRIPCRLVGYSKDNMDVVVLALEQQIGHTLPAPPSRNKLAFSQEVYFLGFPYNMRVDVGAFLKYPTPFVKKAIISGMEPGKYGALYLDGINNPGFSGGPIVFEPHGSNTFHICGVVSGFRTEDIIALKGEDEAETDLVVRLNTGIIIGCPIEAATDVIAENPIGFRLPTASSQ
jgi:hypothetical protein